MRSISAANKSRLVAARAGADFEDDVLLVIRVARQQQEAQSLFDSLQTRGERVRLGARQLTHLLVVRRIVKLLRAGEFLSNGLQLAVLVHDLAEAAVLLAQLRVVRRVGKNVGRGKLFGQSFVAGFDVA